MFDALRELRDAVTRLVVPAGPDALAELVAIHDMLGARIAAATGEVDASGACEEHDGAVSTAAWLRGRCRQTDEAARRAVRTARRLRHLPGVARAWEDGRLSSGQVEVIVTHVGRHWARFAAQEAHLVAVLAPLRFDATVAAMRQWRARADALDDGPEPDSRPDTLHLSRTLAGRGELRASLGGDVAEVVSVALRAAEVVDHAVPPAERRAQALVEICRQFLDAGARAADGKRPGRRHRPHLNVVVDVAQLDHGQYVGGGPVDPAALGALLCDAAVHRVLTEGRSAILDVGRATRTIPAALFDAVVLRDQRCRWPDCDRPASWCDGHHVVPWQEGGHTALGNLVLLRLSHEHADGDDAPCCGGEVISGPG